MFMETDSPTPSFEDLLVTHNWVTLTRARLSESPGPEAPQRYGTFLLCQTLFIIIRGIYQHGLKHETKYHRQSPYR
jgi:hypothetical protein